MANGAETYYPAPKLIALWGTGTRAVQVDLQLLAAAAVAGWRLLAADDALNRASAKAGIPH